MDEMMLLKEFLNEHIIKTATLLLFAKHGNQFQQSTYAGHTHCNHTSVELKCSTWIAVNASVIDYNKNVLHMFSYCIRASK